MNDLSKIGKEVHLIKEQLIEKVPSHFGMKHVVTSFFGALFVGITFMPKGFLSELAHNLDLAHMTAIVITTLLILSGEIYFIGYQRVKNKAQRTFVQFWIKRLSTYYLIALFVSTMLVLVYGIDRLAASQSDVLRIIVAMSLPCALGASLADLLNQY